MTHRTYLLIAAAALSFAGCTPGDQAAANADNVAEAAGGMESGGAPAANAALAEAESQSGIPCPFAGTKDWKAWVNAMPGPGAVRTLIVIGQVDVGSDGYEGKLTPTFQAESNPPIQHFRLNLVEKAGAKKGWQEVRHDLKPATRYRAVVIDCHGTQVGRVEPVDEAQ